MRLCISFIIIANISSNLIIGPSGLNGYNSSILVVDFLSIEISPKIASYNCFVCPKLSKKKFLKFVSCGIVDSDASGFLDSATLSFFTTASGAFPGFLLAVAHNFLPALKKNFPKFSKSLPIFKTSVVFSSTVFDFFITFNTLTKQHFLTRFSYITFKTFCSGRMASTNAMEVVLFLTFLSTL